ncbi:4-phosphopantetheinyl transferase [Glaciihabitans arcticus]|uniref:4-phosphopantetheinyl transferase n=1 Tax=Glaciihabitans arcticus TaxID=2668039 RepID=A0A4Q9GSK3_9MICO|nr:4-phosphopantetheinyl transferase [Glaciihabitans arcticus]TBN57641.1 4-phosphopantetheinyl transferase [Glaciihabitans arcticus]
MARTLQPADRAEALAALSAHEQGRLDATPRHKQDDFLAGRLLLRRLVTELTGDADVEIVAKCPDCGGPHGQPTVPDSTVWLSLSHGVDAVVAAASLEGRVGVDVERLDQPEALEAIRSLTGEATTQRWTRVEAILKADGRGLRVDPSQVVIEGDTGWVRGEATRYALEERELAPGLRASLAAEF